MAMAPVPSDAIPLEGKNVDVSSADADFNPPIRGFYVSAAADVKVTFPNATTGWDVMVIPGCIPGVLYMGRISKIWTAGTTGTGKANIGVVR